MNTSRRKSLQNIIDKIEDIKCSLENLLDQEDFQENIPENLQSSEQYEKADAACDSLKKVQYLTGHADVTVLLKIYSHVKQNTPENLADFINAAM